MNILVSTIGSEYADEWISRVLSKLELNNCGIAYRDRETEKRSLVDQYATHRFYHVKMKEGNYDDFEELMQEAPPVDSKLLSEMAPYENQVFWMMERCESVDFNTRWEHYITHIRFWNYILDKLEIGVCFSITTPHEVYDYIIYCLCRIRGIKYITGFGLSYYCRYHLLEDIYEPLPMLHNELEVLKGKYKDAAICDIVLRPDIKEMYDFYTGQNDRTPYYMKPTKLIFRKQILNWFYDNWFVARAFANIKFKKGDMPYVRYFWYIFYRISFILGSIFRLCSFSQRAYKWFENKKFLTKVFIENDIAVDYYNVNTEQVDYSQNFIYVALHMQPENTSSPLGGVYVDQALMIEMLSYYAPKNWIIYVKENPKQPMYDFQYNSHMKKASLYRSLHFYERIKKCRNVKFVSLKEDTYKLMDNAKAVATLTGTVGLEAITKGIPCLMFGHSYMQYAPNVYPVRTNADCKMAMDSIQIKNNVSDNYNKEIKLFFKALEKYVIATSVEGGDLNDGIIEDCKTKLVDAFVDRITYMQKSN